MSNHNTFSNYFVWNTIGFQKCTDKLITSKWNGAVHTFLEDVYNFEEAKAACKDYSARILSTNKRLDATYTDIKTLELFWRIRFTKLSSANKSI